MNASVDGSDIVYHEYYDIGVAVSTERGLMVPIVRDADGKGFAAIEKEIADYARKAREGSIAIEDLTGGTFTITNGGVFGSLMSTPIVNAPQSAILGMHKIQERPMVVNGQIVMRPDDVPGGDLRSPHHRRPGGRAVPGGDQGRLGGSGADAARGLKRTAPVPRRGGRNIRSVNWSRCRTCTKAQRVLSTPHAQASSAGPGGRGSAMSGFRRELRGCQRTQQRTTA